jgi:hypothetical protein
MSPYGYEEHLETGDRPKSRFEGSVGSSLQESGREDDMPTCHFESTNFDYEHIRPARDANGPLLILPNL